MKHILIVLTFIGVIGGLVFYDQVLAVFDGMTPLESLRMIWSFVLHAVVTTILGYAGLLAYREIVLPGLRMLRQKRKTTRRGRIQPKAAAPRAPRVNKDSLLVWLASQLQRRESKATATTEALSPDEARIRFER